MVSPQFPPIFQLDNNMPKPQDVLARALCEIGLDEQARLEMTSLLKSWEARHQGIGRDLREEVSAHVVDALYGDVGEVTKTLKSGVKFTLPYRSKIAREYALSEPQPDHVWEPQTTRTLLELANSARQVIIGGAYAGDHAVLMAHKMASAGGHVHCFEPNDEQRTALSANAGANGLSNLDVRAEGLWDSKTFLRFEGDDSHARTFEVDAGVDQGIPTVTIDGYCAETGIGQLDLIVLDIEGGEVKALEGAAQQLAKPAGACPDIVFEIHGAYTDWSNGLEQTDVLRLVLDAGYTAFAIRDYQGNAALADAPLELVPTDDAYLEGPPHGFNLIATKRPDLAADIGAKVRRGVSPKILHHRDPALHQPIID